MRVADRLDVRILRTMYGNDGLTPVNPHARASAAALAARLGVSEGTIRNRLRSLLTSGFVHDVRLIPNPSLLGIREVNVLAEVSPDLSKADVVDGIRQMDGLVILVDFHTRLLGVVFASANEGVSRRTIEELRRMTDARRLLIGQVLFPPCTQNLTPRDWEILRELHRNPWRDLIVVGKRIGISGSAVGKRLSRLLDSRGCFVMAQMDPNAITGGVLATILVEQVLGKKAPADREISQILDEYLISTFHQLPVDGNNIAPCAYNLVLPNLPSGARLCEFVRAVDGVQSARFEVFEQVVYEFKIFEDALERAATSALPQAP